jgi:protoporphyrin/coproporphyrin ferrochelatase
MAGDEPRGRKAVLLLFYGGPDSLEDVPSFLAGLRGRPAAPELVARTTERYRAIGGASPALAITASTARRLAAVVNLPVFIAARHWRPTIENVIAEMVAAGLDHVLAVCMAPHYSDVSVGAYRRRVEAAASSPGACFEVVAHWHLEADYVAGLAEAVRSTLARFSRREREGVVVLFSAHSLPKAALCPGDPYEAQLEETAAAVAADLGLGRGRWTCAYQSASGPRDEWLGPSVEEAVTAFAAQGVPGVVLCPAGFVSDQVETLFDVDVALAALARELGLHMERTPLLNDGARTVRALAGLVRRWEGEG